MTEKMFKQVAMVFAVFIASGCGSSQDTAPAPLPEPRPTTDTGDNESSGTASENTTCIVGTPPAGYDDWYKKSCNVLGINILSSERTEDAALVQAAKIVVEMLQDIPEIRKTMIANRLRVGIMAEEEVATDIPEHSDLYEEYPGTDWDNRGRGYGATMDRPVSSASEENLLCLSSDYHYPGQSIMVHEFAHSIDNLGITPSDSSFQRRLKAAYESAISQGLWSDTYAGSNSIEYWAVGVQIWFHAGRPTSRSDGQPDGIYNHIDSRDELLEYDPALHDLIAEYFPAIDIDYCP